MKLNKITIEHENSQVIKLIVQSSNFIKLFSKTFKNFISIKILKNPQFSRDIGSYIKEGFRSQSTKTANKSTILWDYLSATQRDYCINNMQRVNDTESSRQIETRDAKAIVHDGLTHVEETNGLITGQKGWKGNWKKFLLLALIVGCSIAIGIAITAQSTSPQKPIIVSDQPDPDLFNFWVHCPVSYLKDNSQNIRVDNDQSTEQDFKQKRRLFESYKTRIDPQTLHDKNFFADRTYLIEARSFTENNVTKLYYCGLLRGFYDTCQNAVYDCSTPGPMFDIPDRQSIDIIWINGLDSNNVPDITDNCMDPSYPDQNYCTLMKKINKTQTFEDPTGLEMSSSTMDHMRIGQKSWPITTHVHGAQIRPTFDGNPLSWIDNNINGSVGVAYFSLNEDCYYNAFDSTDQAERNFNPPKIKLIDVETGKVANNYKINRYPNQQNPGTLWYHDHAMHLTSYNVQHGLAGFFILRDEVVEKKIGVPRHNEKLVMFSGVKLYNSFGLTKFVKGEVYRFKFLNSNFNDAQVDVLRISFSYNNCTDDIYSRQTFSIIGADSSLFNESIDNQVSFVLAQAERIEILINFTQGNQNEFAICADFDIESITSMSSAHHGRGVSPLPESLNIMGLGLVEEEDNSPSESTLKSINNIVLDVPYTDLSLVPEDQIAVKRMRPLIWMGHDVFTINGRTDFHKGRSENPTLGTIEDWFLINTIWFQHPIHVHLINFQVVKEYTLRTVYVGSGYSNCSIYELDFLIAAMQKLNTPAIQQYKKLVFKNGVDASGGIDYFALCLNITSFTSDPNLGQDTDLRNKIDTMFLEDEINQDTKVSGFDLFPIITEQDRNNFEGLDIYPPIDYSDPKAYKYIENDGAPSKKPYYSRWKDTAYVEEYKVLQYRIRWTKSNFTEDDAAKGTYFHVPADQLREYPGYVYHCHILPHEDNEMMRPIMIQLPPTIPLDKETPCNYNLQSKEKNYKWSQKYNCINKHCHNMPTV